MAVDPEIMRLRAKWDQVDAWVRELEAEGEELPGARYGLAFAKVQIDYAEQLAEINEEYE